MDALRISQLAERAGVSTSTVRYYERIGLVPMPSRTPSGYRAYEPQAEARLLVIHAPAMDAYFAGLHELWNRAEPPTPDEERALMARFGMEAV